MAFREVTELSIILRILSALLVGGIIGLERGTKNRPAGLRTYMLVCVGSCLIMLTNQYIYQFTGAGDPMRLGAQVVSGIGFLGAGTIMVTKRNQIRGLTTAAGLWASAGVGLALGIGFYEAALTATISIYSILTILQKWEHRAHKKIRFLDIYVELHNSVPLSELTQALQNLGFHVESVQFDSDMTIESNARSFVIALKSVKKEDHLVLLRKVRDLPCITYIEEL